MFVLLKVCPVISSGTGPRRRPARSLAGENDVTAAERGPGGRRRRRHSAPAEVVAVVGLGRGGLAETLVEDLLLGAVAIWH